MLQGLIYELYHAYEKEFDSKSVESIVRLSSIDILCPVTFMCGLVDDAALRKMRK